MTGRRRGDVATVASTERQHPDCTGADSVERVADLLDDDSEPLRMSAGGIVVLEVPLAPVARHAGTVVRTANLASRSPEQRSRLARVRGIGG